MRRFVYSNACGLFLAVFLMGSSLPALAGNTIHVPADQPTIQAGINAAVNGDTVLVSPGTYYENINLNGKVITLTSTSGAAATVIDGQQIGPVVTFASNETKQAVLSGFTIQNGNGANFLGGGISISNASPTITRNVVTLSTSCDGGSGISVSGGNPLIQNNMVVANTYGISCGAYAAVYISGTSSAQVIGNIIAGNNFGGLYIALSSGSVGLTSNSVIFNPGPGVTAYSAGATVALVQNLISGNQDFGVSLGPGVSLINNTITNNSTQGGVYNASEINASLMNDQVTMDNNLVISIGIAPALYCQSYDSNNPPVFNNNDLFALQSQGYFSCPDLTGIAGNISADPVFVDLLGNNLHLQSTSPALDAGNNSAPGLPKTDFDGDLRVLNAIVDMGVDEYSAKAALTLSAYGLYYSAQQMGTSSAPQTLILTNHKNVAVKLTWISAGADFSQTNNCPASLSAGTSCQINVVFSPVGGGTRNGAVGIFTSATNNPLTVVLTGTGLVPVLSLSTTFMQFYAQVIGTTGSQTATITNTGQAPLTISNFILTQTSNDFSQTNNCPLAPQTLAVNATCTITLSYTPSVVGYENATLAIFSNTFANPANLYLDGSSVSAGVATLSPTSLAFPTTVIGSNSAPQTVTLTNTGTGTLGNIGNYTSNDFPTTSNCPISLAPGASCQISVSFIPSYSGSEYGSVVVFNDSQFSSYIQVSGTGIAAVPAVSSLSLSSVYAGSSDLLVTATGTGFYVGTQMLVNGTSVASSAQGFTQMNFIIPSANLAVPGTLQISAFNPSPGGGTSNALPFTVYAPINYAVKSTTYNYRNITGTNLNLYYYSGVQITSPFPVQFGGGSYTNLTVSAGGTISFSFFYNPYNDVIPTTQVPTLIAPFWAQLAPSFGSTTDNNVFWQVLGTAPNRQLVIEWRNVGICCEATNTIRFEVVFFEGNSNILFNYADTIFGGSYSSYDNGALATVGVQVAPNLGNQFSYNQPSLTSKSALLWYPNNPTATLSTSTVAFGYHQIGTSTLPQPLTLTNGGLVPLAISSIATDNPDFTQTNSCGASVAPHHSCTINVVFKPSQPSAETATLTITDNASTSPQTVALTGIGSITSVVVYPVLVNFGSVAVGSTGTAPVTLANASNQTMTIQKITTSPSVYAQTNTCGSSLAPGLSCMINVTFTPAQKGSVQGTLSMGLNGKAVTVKANLTGSGT